MPPSDLAQYLKRLLGQQQHDGEEAQLMTDGIGQRQHSTEVNGVEIAPTSRILDLVQAEGGRIYQGDIADRLDCSAATVSRRVTEMEEANEIVRVTIGQQKVVCLPGMASPDRTETVPDPAA